MRLLPILWSETPTAEDWALLSAARIAIGYTDMVKPVQALPGSPGTLLVIGTKRPSWLQNYYACDDITNESELQHALGGALREDERAEAFGELLSGWMDATVIQTGEVMHDESVGFST